MRVVLRTGGLFWEKELRDFLNDKKQTLFEEVDSLGEDPVLTTPFEELCAYLVAKHSLSAPEISEAEARTETEDVQIDLRTRGYVNPDDYGRPVLRKGTRFTVLVPFTGNPELFDCRPSTATDLAPPEAVVRDQELACTYELLPAEAALLETKFNHDLASLTEYLGSIAHDLKPFNSSIREQVPQHLSARSDKLRQDRQIAAKLGTHTRRPADVAETRGQPKVESDVAQPPPPVSQELEAPQPPPDFPEITHSDDYKTLIVGDQDIPLQPMAVRAIHFIYEEWKRTGKPDVDEETVLKNIPTQQDSLYKAVRHGRRQIWNKMIRRGNAKGTVRLILSAFAKNA